jgi:hypothetical protein
MRRCTADDGWCSKCISNPTAVMPHQHGFCLDLVQGLSPIHVGSDAEHPVLLSACDWRDSFLDQSRQVRQGPLRNGVWGLVVERAGTYEIALGRWPVEAELPIRSGAPEHRGEDQLQGRRGRQTTRESSRRRGRSESHGRVLPPNVIHPTMISPASEPTAPRRSAVVRVVDRPSISRPPGLSLVIVMRHGGDCSPVPFSQLPYD